jgi:hypothetical protein
VNNALPAARVSGSRLRRLCTLAAAAAVAAGCGGSSTPAEPASATPHASGPGPAAAVENETAAAPSPSAASADTIASRFAAPPGYERIDASPGGFGAWLRERPLLPGRPDVLLYDGRRKRNQRAHAAVLNLDTGSSDLQQCADAVIRLRAEYLFQGPCASEIAFDFTSGDRARWADWSRGVRPVIDGNRVRWERSAAPDDSYASFRRYLDTVFTYAGTASLERELVPVDDPSRPEIGDVFINGGHPGHAVLVVDAAQAADGERAFLLAQSYMPAQQIHVLRSYTDIEPWYRARAQGTLMTPEWEFRFEDLRRFEPTACDGAPPHAEGPPR